MNQSNNLNLNIDSRIAWFGCVKRTKSLNKSPSYVVRAETIHCFIDHHGPINIIKFETESQLQLHPSFHLKFLLVFVL